MDDTDNIDETFEKLKKLDFHLLNDLFKRCYASLIDADEFCDIIIKNGWDPQEFINEYEKRIYNII